VCITGLKMRSVHIQKILTNEVIASDVSSFTSLKLFFTAGLRESKFVIKIADNFQPLPCFFEYNFMPIRLKNESESIINIRMYLIYKIILRASLLRFRILCTG
jgi:hypothetical protein